VHTHRCRCLYSFDVCQTNYADVSFANSADTSARTTNPKLQDQPIANTKPGNLPRIKDWAKIAQLTLEHTRRRRRRTTITSLLIFSCFQLSFLPSLRSHVRTPRPVLPQHTLVPLPKRAEFQHPPQFQNKLDAKPVILIFMPFDSQTRSSSSSSSTSPTSCMHLSYCCSRVPPQTVNPR
jgi:hypothetical protein